MNDQSANDAVSSHPGQLHQHRGRQRRTWLPQIMGIGLTLTLAAGACTSESASTWTAAPVADASTPSPAPEQDGSPGAAATAATQEPPAPGRAEPLEPPPGNVIPRFVEPERADQPDAADAIPAPIAVEPDATPSATTAPATDARASASRTEPQPSAQGTSEPAVVAATLVAENTAFDVDELTVSARATVRLTLENRDSIPHSFAVYLTDAADEPVFEGEPFSGPGVSRTYEFTSPIEPGDYFFRCDIHPELMTGTLIVE